jgi:predicted Fe-Mo cluster-binding NifX family protein
VLYPADLREEPVGRHLSLEYSNKEKSMKVAVITDDGKTISRHFGRAPYYVVLTIEDGQIIHREMRNKLGHGQFQGQHSAEGTHEHGHGPEHGRDATSHNKHISMAEAISDCSALICGGMGMGAYDSMRRLNVQPVVTDMEDIEAAAIAFVEGRLVDRTELLH